MIKQAENTRIEYLDALRGFTMTLVVLSHVAYMNLGINVGSNGNFHLYFSHFRLPIFFFISGFLLYKPNFVWTTANIKSFLTKKIFVQIISPTIFLLFFTHYKNISFLNAMTNAGKVGYWFTYALFNCFILYIILKKTLDAIKLREDFSLLILLFIGATLYYIPFYNILVDHNAPVKLLDFFLVGKMHYFFFFVFGVYIKKYFTKFEKILDTTSLISIAVILFFALSFFGDHININAPYIITGLINKTTGITLAISGIIITLSFFRKNEKVFSGNNAVGNVLKFIGKRTLDIYLIHYFFLTPSLQKTFTFFAENKLPVLEFTVSLIMTAIIIAASLFISSILRFDNRMAHYLFGAKKEAKK